MESAVVRAGASPTGLERVRQLNVDGRYREAEDAARSLLPREEPGSVESLETAHILDELAIALRRGGGVQSEEAFTVCRRSLAIKEQLAGNQSLDYAVSLHNFGTLLAYRGEYRPARDALEEARGLRELKLGPDHADVASTLVPLSYVLRQEGNVAEARTLLERAVSILEKSSDGPELVRALLSLGDSMYDSGDYADAASTLERALEVASRSLAPGHPDLGICHQNLGALLTETGDYEQARRHYELGLSIRMKSLPPDHPMLASSYEAIGYLDELLRKYRSAGTYYAKAARIQERALGSTHPTTARLWTRLAGTELRTGDLPHASQLLQRALAVQESTLGPTHPEVAWTLDGIAATEEARGDLDLALSHYERARDIRIASYGRNYPDVSISMVLLSRVHHRRGDKAAALNAALESASINLENLSMATQALADRHALAYAAIQSSGHEWALSLLCEEPAPSSTDIGRVWGAWIRARNVVLDEMVKRQRFLGSSPDSALGDVGASLAESRIRLSHMLVRGLEDQQVEVYKRNVDSLRSEVERCERQIASWDGRGQEQRSSAIGYEAVAQAIPEKSALVAYCWYGPSDQRRYAAFVQRSSGEVHLVRLGEAAAIESRIANWLRLASGTGGTNDISSLESACRKEGARLRAAIWDGIQVHLEGVGRVFVVLDGALYRVNLAALPVGSKYLVETGPLIHYLPAERDLIVRGGSRTGHGLLAVGGADFDAGIARVGRASTRRGAEPNCIDLSQHRFEPLPATLQEVTDLAALWGEPSDVYVRSGAEARESSVRREAPGRRVVHLATHGFFVDGQCTTDRSGVRGMGSTVPAAGSGKGARSRPRVSRLVSGLAFAGANEKRSDGGDDGILTSEEIASLSLQNVEWVVLSACDTGLGRPQAGEGILGMRRAFQIAGARTVIMSLWAVDDAATRSWMLELYQARLKDKLTTAESVREASLRVLRERRAQARSTLPFYWAGFVASGQWN